MNVKKKKTEFWFITDGSEKWYSYFFVWQFLAKLNTLLPYDPTTTICGICPSDLKMYAHKPLFVAALFLIAKIWKQPRYPSLRNW